MADVPYERVLDYTEYINKKFTQQKLIGVKYLRKVNPEAYAYMIKVDRVLEIKKWQLVRTDNNV